MKKTVILFSILSLLVLGGCQSRYMEPDRSPDPNVQISPIPTDEPVEEPKNTIALTQTLKMTNDWTIVGDCNFAITQKDKKDRVVLATSAGVRGEGIMWDDSQYWTLAVITGDGAYNLFSQRMQGYVYFEASETYLSGKATPVITAYIFSGTDREIRNYFFEDGVFVEHQEYSTKQFSTGGINNIYSSLPEPTQK